MDRSKTYKIAIYSFSLFLSLSQNRKVSPLIGKQIRLALGAKTNSTEDVCGICTMWLLLTLGALSKNGAITYVFGVTCSFSHPAKNITF